MKSLFSFGNIKVGKDTAIFNMNPAKLCPSAAMGLCSLSDKCYAKKAERLYPHCLPYRVRQMEYWQSVNANDFVVYFKTVLQLNQNKIKFLRFSECGDFVSQSDVNKLSCIAEQLKDIVKVYTYTARKDLDFSNVSDNLTINGSGFMVHNNFYVYRNESELIDKIICPGSCLNCNLCKVSKNRNIAVKLH